VKFDIWLEEALAKDTWPVTRGYTKTADGEDFEPPIPVYIELSDYWEDGSRVSVKVTAKGKKPPLDIPSEELSKLQRRTRELCENALGTDNFVIELSLHKPVALEGEVLQKVLTALGSVGYAFGKGTWKQVHPGEHVYWVNAKKNWTREYRIYMAEGYHWTIEGPKDEEDPEQEVLVRFDPDDLVFLDLKCGNVSPDDLMNLLAFVKRLKDR